MVLSLGLAGLKIYLKEMVLVKERRKEKCCKSFAMNRNYEQQILGLRKNEKSKITHRSGGNRTEIDFLLIGRNERKYLKLVHALSRASQHTLVVADIKES